MYVIPFAGSIIITPSFEEVLWASKRNVASGAVPLRGEFIVTDDIFEKDGVMVNFPKLVSCAWSDTVRSRSDPTCFRD